MRKLLWAAVLWALSATTVGAATAPGPGEYELAFELKLLWRGSIAGRARPVDLWSGGALRLRSATPNDPSGVELTLDQPLEHPWVFRWFDDRDEVKLGAEVWVPRAKGDAYGALAPALTALAERRWADWWSDDRVESTGENAPPWISRAGQFWADVHRDELERRDPLPADPVYPFWVLGPLADRFVVRLATDGSIDAGSISQRVSEPWTPDGWRRSLAGEIVVGTGYWDPATRKRPNWAPNGYAALAAALALLDDEVAAERVAESAITALLPRLEGRLGWRRAGGAGDAVSGPVRLEGRGSPRLRVWRRRTDSRSVAHLLVTGEDQRQLKLWIRVELRAVEAQPLKR